MSWMDRKVSLINLSNFQTFLAWVCNRRKMTWFAVTCSSEKSTLKKRNPFNLWQELLWFSRKRKILSRFIERLDLLIWILWLPYVRTIHTQPLSKKHSIKSHIIHKLGNARLKGCLFDHNPAVLCICIKVGSQTTLALSNAQHGWGVPNK